MDESSLFAGEDDDDDILKAVDDDDDRKDQEGKRCLKEINPLLHISDRRIKAVDVSNTENLAAVKNNNGREIIIITCTQVSRFCCSRTRPAYS